MTSDDRPGWRDWLPRAVGGLAGGGFVAAVLVPASWTGPVTVMFVVLAVGAALGAHDRVAALTSLAGIGFFVAGVIGISESTHMPTTGGKVVAIVVASCVALAGLAGFWFRHQIFGPHGITTASLFGIRSATRTRVSVVGVVAIPFSVAQVQGGHLLVAILALVAGLPWLVLMIVFGTSDRAWVLVGAMLTASGAGMVGLGLIGFYEQVFLGGVAGVTVGVAIAGCGLTLLGSTGALSRLRQLFD